MRPPFNTGEFGPGIGGVAADRAAAGPRPDRGPGRGPGRGPSEVPDASDAAGWFAGRLPDDWFVGAPEVIVDRDEITIVGELPALPDGATDAAAPAAAEVGRIAPVPRGHPRAPHRHRSAGRAPLPAQCHLGSPPRRHRAVFTQLSVPVMTRLLQPERQVLDTLIDAGVARSRSEALAWAVRLVGEHTHTWLADLRDAMEHVNKVRSQGPSFDSAAADTTDDADDTDAG